MKRILTTILISLVSSLDDAAAQEWTKPSAGRVDYIQDRTECAQQGQKMALVGDELQKDILECLAVRGWQRNQVNEILDLYCEEKPTVKACRRGANTEIYKKDRADCNDQVLKTVGSTYSRPGWVGLGGLLASSIQAEENKKNLLRLQIASMKICLEGKSWSVELKGELLEKAEK
jgi:hypothetical protein